MNAKNEPVLHFFVGKIAAGKSTLATSLGQAPGTVIVREDEWLAGLFGDEMKTIEDYVRCSGRLRAVLMPHLIALLRTGVSVVADFQANTIEARLWMREIFKNAGCAHRLHFLDVPEDVCRVRLRRRNEEGSHAFAPTDAQFDRITRHFVPPSADEGFDIQTHRPKPEN
ncbi:MAG: ATP-binding protein [Methyloceanibacter sp.]|nr:ATP-binding protein [Methyloceanibacter sp.]